MNQTLSEVLELREYAEERLTAHMAGVNAAEGEDRKRRFNEHLIRYIDELNAKCKEINGGDYDGRYKSLYALINEYQHKFMSRYRL
ncbi:hypothetical protein HB364_26070 [Pseudoflavitalea sp. X16]|uniref:hypothetical protein n=1 Tax=Paraflavitalea devenefica TaxID=2716334 RepID=UPI001423ABB5|nr:hypothetical protein [Paraflavitalea devenefica]NII28577.1 hypothetical protein [Paraflavitalea devenefica]